jgi:hypothetical protein
LGVLFKFLKLSKSDIKKNTVYILFAEDILKEVQPKCWSDTWNFGKCDKKNSIKFDASKSPAENIQVWSTKYRASHPRTSVYSPMSGNGQNEIVFEASIPLVHCRIFTFENEKDIEEFHTFIRKFGYTLS